MTTPKELYALRDAAWAGSLPLEIRLAPSECRVYDQADPLHAFFRSYLIDQEILAHDGWFAFENVPLKWHYPVGLLYDLFSGASPSQGWSQSRGNESDAEATDSQLPWRLTLHFTDWPVDQLVRLDAEGKVLHDAFINSVKEADFLRNGTAKEIMSLSKNDSTQLWKAVEYRKLTCFIDDFAAFNPICQKLLYAQGAPLRHIPMRVYLPSSPSASDTGTRHLKVVQPLVPHSSPSIREQQTLGMALHRLLPSLFPSRRTPILAKPVLHGAVVPMSAPAEDLLRSVAYLDGWLHIGIVMIG
ncbi:autophagy protein 5 [Ptychographa xylographoides]|nr:autophagy protein 5 [Ptychographa xylographoides]